MRADGKGSTSRSALNERDNRSDRILEIDLTMHKLEMMARQLVETEKGLLAADESFPSIAKRFRSLGIPSTEETRLAYRDMLLTSPGIEEYISGVILFDETIREKRCDGTSFLQLLERRGIVPGIKVDKGVVPFAGSPGETITDGLDALRDRLRDYRALGARFTKWRAVIRIAENIPTQNGHRHQCSCTRSFRRSVSGM